MRYAREVLSEIHIPLYFNLLNTATLIQEKEKHASQQRAGGECSQRHRDESWPKVEATEMPTGW